MSDADDVSESSSDFSDFDYPTHQRLSQGGQSSNVTTSVPENTIEDDVMSEHDESDASSSIDQSKSISQSDSPMMNQHTHEMDQMKSSPHRHQKQSAVHGDLQKDLRTLYSFIDAYSPCIPELSMHLTPFIPDFQPFPGTMDKFIKPLRPDGKLDTLGLSVLDEPCTQQSNPAILSMRLSALAKSVVDTGVSDESGNVGAIERAHLHPDQIQEWIDSVADMHTQSRRTAAQTASKHSLPELEDLMQSWDDRTASRMRDLQIPPSDIALSVSEYSRVACALFDIPVFEDDQLASVHHLLSLCAVMRHSKAMDRQR